MLVKNIIPSTTIGVASRALFVPISLDHTSPRSVIVELDGDYLHAEFTSKWMKYVDDLEVSFVPESRKLLVRSESRVGEGDLGVNQKRVDLLKSKLF